MTYKYGNWYCKPANESEAREIVERAVASGAVDRVLNWHFNATYYGVCDGVVKTYSVGTKYTIEQLRKKFPLPGDETEWNGNGSPPVGTVCEIYLGNYHSDRRESGEVVKVLATAKNSNDKTMVLVEICEKDGQCDALNVQCLRPLRSEREHWVEQSLKVLQEDPCALPSQFMGRIYDALKSGTLKAPEVE